MAVAALGRPIEVNVGNYAATGDGTTDDTASINAALTAGAGRIVIIPKGTYRVSFSSHPTAAGVKQALYIPSGTTVRMHGATIKLLNGQVGASGSDVAVIVGNSTYTVGDTDIRIEGGTIDGNGANCTGVYHNLRMSHVDRFLVDGVRSLNHLGSGTSGPGETYGFQAWRSRAGRFRACGAYCTDAQSPGGFSADSSDGIRWDDCEAFSMSVNHGFTHWNSANLDYVSCRAGLNNGAGFNSEQSWNVTYMGCNAGGEAPSYNPSQTTTPWTYGQSYANSGWGFVNLGTQGGGRVRYIGCDASGHVDVVTRTAAPAGWLLSGSRQFTAQSGTTGSTVVGPASTFYPMDVGRRIICTGGVTRRIATYVSDTTVTLSGTHGSSSGQTVTIFGPDVQLIGCTATRNRSGALVVDNGVPRFYDAAEIDLRGCNLYANTNHDWDSNQIMSESGYVSTGGNPAVPASGTKLNNPFPMPMQVVIQGGTMTAVQLASRDTSAVTVTINATDGVFILARGGGITLTYTVAPTWSWFAFA